MKKLTSTLATAPLEGKQILVRADLNVPRDENGAILNDFKFQSLLPTLHLIKLRGGKITLITHSGRPEKQEPSLSTKPFVAWFTKNGFTTTFAKDPEEALKYIKIGKFKIVLLENLRFFKGEKEQSTEFAESLSQLGNFFVQDAFGNLHRPETSMTLLPQFFDSYNKTIGLLVEKELSTLVKLKDSPRKPFVLIIGGNKPATKLPVIENLLDMVNAVLLCPALAFTLLKADGKSVGKSLVEAKSLETARRIIQKAAEKNVTLVFPVDYMVTSNTFEKPFPLTVSSSLTSSQTGISFGPQTAALFKHCILQAHTIFLNGVSGNPDYSETLEGMRSLFLAIQQTYATKVIGGGDTVSVAQKLGFNDLGFFSTGGGATLAYLSNKQLPGLLALCQ